MFACIQNDLHSFFHRINPKHEQIFIRKLKKKIWLTNSMYPEVLFILQKKSGNEMRLKKYEHLIHIHLFKICIKIITIQIILSLTSIHWHYHHSLLMITGKNHWFFCHYFHLFISYPFVKTSIKYLFWKVFYVKTFVKVLDSSLFTSFFCLYKV